MIFGNLLIYNKIVSDSEKNEETCKKSFYLVKFYDKHLAEKKKNK